METIDFGHEQNKARVLAIQGSLYRQVYAWMGAGLLLTAVVALLTASLPSFMGLIIGNSLVFFGLIIVELGLVLAISAAIRKLSAAVAAGLFMFYSLLNGVTMSVIFVAFTSESIASTFVITAGMFGAMSAYGYLTRRDLTSWGSFLFMGLVGVVLASLFNMFMNNDLVYWVSTFCGVIVFTGLAAYDTQKIKDLAAMSEDGADMTKPAILGALMLYLDFINLFLMLLRLFGRKD